MLTTYTFNTGIASILSAASVEFMPLSSRSHPHSIDVNIRCLDGDVLSRFEIVPFDGANWEQNIHKLRSE